MDVEMEVRILRLLADQKDRKVRSKTRRHSTPI